MFFKLKKENTALVAELLEKQTRLNKMEEELATINELLKHPTLAKAIETKHIEDEKQAAYQELVKSPFRYEIIKDFVNAAAMGVVVKFTVDGIPIEIKRDEEKLPNRYSSPTF